MRHTDRWLQILGMTFAVLLVACGELPLEGISEDDSGEVLVGATGEFMDARGSAAHSPTEVRWFETGMPVEDAFSSLLRRHSGVQMTLHTTGLEPGDAFTIWWIIFNYPEHCEHPTEFGLCSGPDLVVAGGDPAVESSAARAAGRYIGGDGTGRFAGSLKVGDTSEALFGPGLLNPAGAEIHLIVRSHGPRVPAIAAEQIHTVDGGCSEDPEEDVCHDPQFAVHVAN